MSALFRKRDEHTDLDTIPLHLHTFSTSSYVQDRPQNSFVEPQITKVSSFKGGVTALNEAEINGTTQDIAKKKWSKPLWASILLFFSVTSLGAAAIGQRSFAERVITPSPTLAPTPSPTFAPTYTPSRHPTFSPTEHPTLNPSANPTLLPSANPTQIPSNHPTLSPSLLPSLSPTKSPSVFPTVSPSETPTEFPSSVPSKAPTSRPTLSPSTKPSEAPTNFPTSSPSETPTNLPTLSPSTKPSEAPTNFPTSSPSETPTNLPTLSPSTKPSEAPTNFPTSTPSETPTTAPIEFFTIIPTLSPVTQGLDELPVFPAEVRLLPQDYVAVSFIVSPPEVAAGAFLAAARRWSDILAGSEVLIGSQQVNGACGRSFQVPFTSDHLLIFSVIQDIDGPGGVLGAAGPCGGRINGLPRFGTMEFDTADIQVLAEDSLLEAVILHEMAHVLGIGTLWPELGLIQDPLPSNSFNPTLPAPYYSGAIGLAEYHLLSGLSNPDALGVEDGMTNGRFNFAGAGSINSHFDQDAMQSELMTFRISRDGSPLSVVTIGALADLGYLVDYSFADPFSLNSLKKSLREKDGIPMVNDTLMDF